MRRSRLLLAAGILGTAYLLYITLYFFGSIFSAENVSGTVAGGLATALVTPHIVCVGLAVAFNWIGWAVRTRWAALVAAILYSVSIVLMFLYAAFVIVQAILCFTAFGLMKQEQDRN